MTKQSNMVKVHYARPQMLQPETIRSLAPFHFKATLTSQRNSCPALRLSVTDEKANSAWERCDCGLSSAIELVLEIEAQDD